MLANRRRPDFVLVGYGISGRVLKAAVELARARGMAWVAPSILFPSPSSRFANSAARPRRFAVVELQLTGPKCGHLRLAAGGAAAGEFYNRMGAAMSPIGPRRCWAFSVSSGCRPRIGRSRRGASMA